MTTGKIINCLLHNNTTINGPAGLYFLQVLQMEEMEVVCLAKY